MTQIPYLPVFDVYMAFNPTYSGATLFAAPQQALPASGASNSYWTNVSAYLRDFTTNSGKQHYLDRVEAGTLRATFNGRTGFFFNGAAPSGGVDGNGTGYVIQPRLPIAITATWSSTTYPVFWGVIDNVQEQVTNQVDVDLLVDASDLTKYLSLCYMTRQSFWPTYAQSTSAQAWYRMGTPSLATVTNAVGGGTTVTYTAQNTFTAGQNVTVTGLGTGSGSSLNLNNVVIASASASQFTVTNSTVGQSSGTGTAYRTIITDQMGGTSGNYLGAVSWPTYGAMIYDTNSCVDLTNGSSAATGLARFPAFTSSEGGLDFWVLGQNIAGSIIAQGINTGSNYILLECTSSGLYQISVAGTLYTSSVQINDGYWHHVGIVDNGSGTLQGYVDGAFFSIGSGTHWTAPTNLAIGNTSPLLGGLNAYVDEVVVSNTSSLSTLQNEIKSRYRAGTLLQLGFPVTSATVLSGDRIAEVLLLAGFGSIVNGAIVLPSNFYYINNGSAWVNGTSGNGFVGCEPWYWDSPITESTALDLIGQICDTDIGSFVQSPKGTVNFYNQSFYGTWTWTVSTSSGTWSPNSYSPASDHIWTDDGSGYAYDGPTLQVNRDDADTWTLVKITPQAGVDQIYENSSAEARWGLSTLTKTGTIPTALTYALSAANFLGYLFRSPLPRVSNVELWSETNNGAYNTAIVGAVLGDVVEFKRTSPNASTGGTYPTQMGRIDQNMVIEAKSLEFVADPGTLRASFTLDPYPVRS